MALERQDALFLSDFVKFNWMQRVVATYSFTEAGARPRPFALPPMRLLYPGRTDEELLKIVDQVNEARVQAILTARIFGEFFGALEDAGAFFRAIHERQNGGILANNVKYDPRQVRRFYEAVRAAKTPRAAWALLRFPGLKRLERVRGLDIYRDVTLLHKQGGAILRQAARSYLAFPQGQLLRLNTGRVNRRWNELVHVLVALDAPGQHTPISGRGLLEVTHNKIKHGFNVLESVPDYAKLRRLPRLMVAKMGRREEDVSRLRHNIENLAMSCRTVGQAVLRLDGAGLWR